jgi:hypothetical protein
MGNWEEAVASIRSGDRFGKLVVLGYDAVKGGRFACECDCGRQMSMAGQNLVMGWAISCGCTPCNVCRCSSYHRCSHSRALHSGFKEIPVTEKR